MPEAHEDHVRHGLPRGEVEVRAPGPRRAGREQAHEAGRRRLGDGDVERDGDGVGRDAGEPGELDVAHGARPERGPWPGMRVSRTRLGTRGRKAWASRAGAVVTCGRRPIGSRPDDGRAARDERGERHPPATREAWAQPPARPADDHLER